MASFGAQAAIRSKWTDLVESPPLEIPAEVTSGVRSVVGWLKQASLEVRQAGKRTLTSFGGNMAPTGNGNKLTILHYNDVYNVEPQKSEPVGGAARFSHKMKSFASLNPIILFSGDIFSPSTLSTMTTQGEHMVFVLNELNTQCAVFGNHDFDFGLEVLSKHTPLCNFPWLMSNVIDNETGRPLGDGKISYMVPWQNQEIGIIGLVEREWLDTLPTINPEQITFMDYVETGKKLASQLKKEGCSYVIALTHMRTPNDLILAEKVKEIDLILGGHDHVFEVNDVSGTKVIKSGTDFRQFSKITLTFGESVDVDVEAIDITSEIPEDPIMVQHINTYADALGEKMNDVLGTFVVPLNGKFSCIRTSETNLGNWICDAALAATNADCVLLNSGTFRSDTVHPSGDFTVGDLCKVLPQLDTLCLIDVTGKVLLKALENGVSAYPKLEGRFPQVAGMSFAFDPRKKPMDRVDARFVRIGDEYLNLDAHYRLATKLYVYHGCDGYDDLKESPLLMDEEVAPELTTAVRNHFQAIQMRKSGRISRHRQSLVTLSRRHSLVKTLEVGDAPPVVREQHSPKQSAATPTTKPPSARSSISPGRGRLARRASVDDLEQETCELSPKVENRIIIIDNDEKLKELLDTRKRFEADSVIPEADTEDGC